MANPRLEDGSSLRISSLRPQDVREIHAAYDLIGREGQRFFHPGFLGAEPLSMRGIAGRLILRMSARPAPFRMLRAVPFFPFLVGVVARLGFGVCGFAFVLVRPRIGRRGGTFGVFVVPGAEGRGIGSQLTEAVLRAARDEGLREVELTVQVANTRARRLYERGGFAVVETVPQGDVYREEAYDCVRMTLRLGGLRTPHDDATSS